MADPDAKEMDRCSAKQKAARVENGICGRRHLKPMGVPVQRAKEQLAKALKSWPPRLR